MEEYKRRIELLNQEEKRLQFAQFTNETAFEIGNRIIESAKAENKVITIGIRRNGQRLFHYAMSGTSKDNDDWIERKSNIVEQFGHSSYYMSMYYQIRGTTMKEKSGLSEREYAAAGGAFPLFIKNVGLVGVIAVSGLSQEEDHNLVVKVIQSYLEA